MYDEKAVSRGVSLFQMHYAIVEQCAVELKLRGSKTFSPAVQHIIEEYEAQRQMLALLPGETVSQLRYRAEQTPRDP